MGTNEVLKKLRKLQKLYEGASRINSEGEAAAAASAIQRLLTEYNLSMEEVTVDENAREGVTEERASGYTYKSIGGQWEMRLCHVLCKYNFCRCYSVGGTYRNLLMFGKRENLETVKWLREVLSEKFVAFSKDRFKEYQKTVEYAYHKIGKDTYQRSYLKGAVTGLEEKLAEEDRRAKEADTAYGTKVTALVTRNDSEILEYINAHYHATGSRTTTDRVNDAYRSGREDGRNTSINKPISSRQEAATRVGLLG